jgi:hypothetical protein
MRLLEDVLGFDIAAFLLPEADNRSFIAPHDDSRLRAVPGSCLANTGFGMLGQLLFPRTRLSGRAIDILC